MYKFNFIFLLLLLFFINTQSFGQSQARITPVTTLSEPELGIELLPMLDYIDRFPTDCDFVASHPKDPYNFSYILPTYTNLLNPAEAIPACEKAFAERPDLRNAYLLGRSYDIGDQHEKSFIYLKAAAERGYRIAQNNLGVLYLDGLGVAQDVEKAAYWYHQSAEQGDQVAQTNLGVLYREGTGVPQSMEVAFSWFELAARTRDWYAQFNMGYMYLNGFGVDRDPELAFDWFMVSARQNYEPAMFQLGEMLAANRGHQEAQALVRQIQARRASR